MGSEVKGAEGGRDALSLGDNIQLNMDDAAKVKLSYDFRKRKQILHAYDVEIIIVQLSMTTRFHCRVSEFGFLSSGGMDD